MRITCSSVIVIKPSVSLFNAFLTSYLYSAIFFWWGFLSLQILTYTSFFFIFWLNLFIFQLMIVSQWEHIPQLDLKFERGSSQYNFFPSCSLLHYMFLIHDTPDCSQDPLNLFSSSALHLITYKGIINHIQDIESMHSVFVKEATRWHTYYQSLEFSMYRYWESASVSLFSQWLDQSFLWQN